MGDQVKRWIAIPQDAPGSQSLFAGIRFTLAGILAIVFGSLFKRKWIALGIILGGKIGMGGASGEVENVLQAAGSVQSSVLPAAGVLLYLSFLSAAAYTIWGILLKYNPVSRVAVYGFSNPVIGVFLSAMLLGEAGQAFTLKNVGALALVCAGILVVNVTARSGAVGMKNGG